MANVYKLGTVDGSQLGNPPSGDAYEFYDSNNLDPSGNPRLTRRDDSGADTVYTSGVIPTVINDLTDVDTATTAPTEGSYLRWNNANSEWETYNPIHKFISSADQTQWRASQTTEGLINQASGTYEDYLTLTLSSANAADYKLSCNFVASYNDAGSNFLAQLDVSGDVTATYDFLAYEPKDVGGTGEDLDTISGGTIGATANSGTDVRESWSFANIISLTAGQTITLKLQ